MLIKVQSFLCILQFFLFSFFINVLTQDLEVTVELDSIGDNLEGNDNIDNHLTENVSGSKESGGYVQEKKQSKEERENKQLTEYNKNDRVSISKSLSMEDSKTEKLILKNDPDVKEEPGFDLTTEEMQKFKIWKDGVIPYYIDVVSFSDKVFRDSIRSFLRMVNDVTGLNFEVLPAPPSNANERWVFFINRRGLLGCADHTTKNFTNQGVQQVVLGYDCFATKGELAEAVMSIVGVPAQHNAPDRDTYIKVNTENIMPDKRHLFEKLRDDEWLFHDLEYDLHSVTHYDMHKYSANGRATIEPKKDSENIVLAKSLSPFDILKIKMLYNYISRNKKLQLPECEKLFKPRSKYERFSSEDDNIKPREKPSRYSGIADYDVEKGFDEENEAGNKNNEDHTYVDSKEDEKTDNGSKLSDNESRAMNELKGPNDPLYEESDYYSDDKKR